MLGEDRRPLLSLEPVEMIIGSIQVADAELIEDGKFDEESRKLSEDMIEAVLSRDDELLQMSIS